MPERKSESWRKSAFPLVYALASLGSLWTYDTFGTAELGEFQIPVVRTTDCPLEPDADVITTCNVLSGQEIGPVVMAHNETLVKPGQNEAASFVGVNPGGELLRHEGDCVPLGNYGEVEIGPFKLVDRFKAWFDSTSFRVITSYEESDPWTPEVKVYMAELTPCTTPAEKILHTVMRGDNLSRIARAYGMTVRDLAAANAIDLSHSVILPPGQQLIIPLN